MMNDSRWSIGLDTAKNRYDKFPQLKTMMHVIASQLKIDLKSCTESEFISICELAWERTGAK